MFPYKLPPTFESDLVVVLDASHAFAFLQASNAALRVMEGLGQGQSALGILKTRHNFILGRMEFSNVTVLDTGSVDDFGSKLMLSEQRTHVLHLRNQVDGHIRAAMNSTMAAFGAKTLHLLFYKAGPVFIISPSEPGKPYRLALIRLEGASSMKDERSCVAVNRASRISYKEIWGMLSKMAIEIAEKEAAEAPQAVDVLDEASSDAEELQNRENEIDGVSGDEEDEDDYDDVSDQETPGMTDDYMPDVPSSIVPAKSNQTKTNDEAEFDINDTSNIAF